MSAPTTDLVDEIRQLARQARQAGEPMPGRPTLVRLTGASEHAVRQALATLESELAPALASPGEMITSAPPAEAAHDHDGEPLEAPGEPVGELAASPGDLVSPASPAPASPAARAVPAPAPAGGRLVAWVGFVFGSLTSVAANVLAARLAPAQAGPGWHPNTFAEVGAAVWPIALLLSVEALSRIRWPKGALWALARFGGAGTVAVCSALISYGHIRAVLVSWGYTSLGASVGPLVIDGLMIICGFALLATATARAASPGGPAGASLTRAGD